MNGVQTNPVLPGIGNGSFLTDGGIETSLIFHQGIDLPHFAAVTLLQTREGRKALKTYYRPYLDVAAKAGTGFVLESPTWRASPDWAEKLGLSIGRMADLNRAAINLMSDLRMGFAGSGKTVISGNIGPRGDGYDPGALMSEDEATDYHRFQTEIFAQTAANLVTGVTINNAPEAVGIVRAAKLAGIPCALAFTVETDGRLPTGQPLGEAIDEVDGKTGSYAAYFMISCAHPDHFRDELEAGGTWVSRIGGLRANASRLSHAELDEAEELDDGDPEEFGLLHRELADLLPNLRVLGGCCGTDHRHVEHVCRNRVAA